MFDSLKVNTIRKQKMTRNQKATQLILAYPTRYHQEHGCYPPIGPAQLELELSTNDAFIELYDKKDVYLYPTYPLEVGCWSEVNKTLSGKRRKPIRIVGTGQEFTSKKECAQALCREFNKPDWRIVTAGISNAMRRGGTAYGYAYEYLED